MEGQTVRLPCPFGSFEGKFALPDNTQSARNTSEFKNGMLTVHLTKYPTTATRTIEIKVT